MYGNENDDDNDDDDNEDNDDDNDEADDNNQVGGVTGEQIQCSLLNTEDTFLLRASFREPFDQYTVMCTSDENTPPIEGQLCFDAEVSLTGWDHCKESFNYLAFGLCIYHITKFNIGLWACLWLAYRAPPSSLLF